jgi:hypothetical protein
MLLGIWSRKGMRTINTQDDQDRLDCQPVVVGMCARPLPGERKLVSHICRTSSIEGEVSLYQEIQMMKLRKFIKGAVVALGLFALSGCAFLGGAAVGTAAGGVGGYELGKSRGTADEKLTQEQAESQQQQQEIKRQQQEIEQLNHQQENQ